jgi:hypothetical protein
MKRYVAALLVVLGVLGVVGVWAVGAGYAKDENAASGAKCSEATLDGTYLFAEDGFFSRTMTRSRPPLQAIRCITATVR